MAAITCVHVHIERSTVAQLAHFYGTPRLPYIVYILFVLYKGHFVMYKFDSLCAKCISL